MSTNSLIAIANKDGTFDSAYCHYDGYVGHNGKVLVKFHNTETQARTVVDTGFIRSLEHDGTIDPMRVNEKTQRGLTFQTLMEIALDYEYTYVFKDQQWFLIQGQSLVSVKKLLSH